MLFLHWANDPVFVGGPDLLLLINPVKSEVNSKILALPAADHQEIQLPAYDERREFVEWFRASHEKLRFEGGWEKFCDDAAGLTELAAAAPSMGGQDLATGVGTTKPYVVPAVGPAQGRVAVFDFGVKRDILGQLAGRGLEVTVVPPGTAAAQVEKLEHPLYGAILAEWPVEDGKHDVNGVLDQATVEARGALELDHRVRAIAGAVEDSP